MQLWKFKTYLCEAIGANDTSKSVSRFRRAISFNISVTLPLQSSKWCASSTSSPFLCCSTTKTHKKLRFILKQIYRKNLHDTFLL